MRVSDRYDFARRKREIPARNFKASYVSGRLGTRRTFFEKKTFVPSLIYYSPVSPYFFFFWVLHSTQCISVISNPTTGLSPSRSHHFLHGPYHTTTSNSYSKIAFTLLPPLDRHLTISLIF